MKLQKIAAIVGCTVTGAIAFGATWSYLDLDNEIKWVQVNKPQVCRVLANQDSYMHNGQRELYKETYKSSTTAINQAFLGTVMTTMTAERQMIADRQLRFGCAMAPFASHMAD